MIAETIIAPMATHPRITNGTGFGDSLSLSVCPDANTSPSLMPGVEISPSTLSSDPDVGIREIIVFTGVGVPDVAFFDGIAVGIFVAVGGFGVAVGSLVGFGVDVGVSIGVGFGVFVGVGVTVGVGVGTGLFSPPGVPLSPSPNDVYPACQLLPDALSFDTLFNSIDDPLSAEKSFSV